VTVTLDRPVALRPLPIIAKCLGRKVDGILEPCPIDFRAPDQEPRVLCPECGTPVGSFEHQREAFALAAAAPQFGLGHDMGCMKSSTTIGLLDTDHATCVLVLCPKNVVDVWPDQLAQHSERDWLTWSGHVLGARGALKNPSVDKRAGALTTAYHAALTLGRPFMAVVNYEAAWQGQMRNVMEGTPWDAVVCDESHRVKLPSGKASKLAALVASRVRDRGGRVLCNTGTAMPHTPLDIWSQMRILDGGERLGTSYHKFCQRFGAAETVWAAGGIRRTVYNNIRPDRLDEFTRLVGEVWHFVSADDVLDLPEAVDRDLTCQLDPASQRAYDELERYGVHEAERGTLTAANAMVLLLRLAQATSGFGRDVDTREIVTLGGDRPPEKARLLADALEDLPVGDPVVVFARFHADLDAIERATIGTGRRYAELSGRRRDGLDGSRMAEGIDVLGAQLQSGGVGIDLTRARVGVYYSQDFRLADYLQSRRRLVRPGQTRPVVFLHLLASGTVDEAIYEALMKRQEVIDQVINYLKEGGAP
jgi:SNF2 family DNA or RNA helicase